MMANRDQIRQLAEEMTKSFIAWADKIKYQTHDPLDLWDNAAGKLVRQMYFKNRFLAAPVVVLMLATDFLFPGLKKIWTQARRHPISDAQIGLGCLNLYKITENESMLVRAQEMAANLLKSASPMARGLGWGLMFDWLTPRGLITKNTPCHTQTAYAYDFFSEFHRQTENPVFLGYLRLIAEHTSEDFYETQNGNKLSSSYSMKDDSRIVNANCYRAHMLIDAGTRFNDGKFLNKGLASLEYVLSMQNDDGSWPYSETNRFVDHYHTCFILKKLRSIMSICGSWPELNTSLQKGLDYYLNQLFDRHGFPLPFSVKSHAIYHIYGSYDLAEAINLHAEFDLEERHLLILLKLLDSKFRTREGWFTYRHYPMGIGKGIPFMRYANSAIFLALTKVLIR